jgi:hypothetical protein
MINISASILAEIRYAPICLLSFYRIHALTFLTFLILHYSRHFLIFERYFDLNIVTTFIAAIMHSAAATTHQR